MTQPHTYRTLADAIAAGHTRGARQTHRGFLIFSRDVSGHGCFGYKFAVSVEPDFRGEMAHLSEVWGSSLQAQEFARTVSVCGTEDRNRGGQLGAWSERYAPGEWESGVEAAVAAIDAWYAARPAAAAAQAQIEAEQAEVVARRESKRFRRTMERGL